MASLYHNRTSVHRCMLWEFKGQCPFFSFLFEPNSIDMVELKTDILKRLRERDARGEYIELSTAINQWLISDRWKSYREYFTYPGSAAVIFDPSTGYYHIITHHICVAYRHRKHQVVFDLVAMKRVQYHCNTCTEPLKISTA